MAGELIGGAEVERIAAELLGAGGEALGRSGLGGGIELARMGESAAGNLLAGVTGDELVGGYLGGGGDLLAVGTDVVADGGDLLAQDISAGMKGLDIGEVRADMDPFADLDATEAPFKIDAPADQPAGYSKIGGAADNPLELTKVGNKGEQFQRAVNDMDATYDRLIQNNGEPQAVDAFDPADGPALGRLNDGVGNVMGGDAEYQARAGEFYEALGINEREELLVNAGLSRRTAKFIVAAGLTIGAIVAAIEIGIEAGKPAPGNGNYPDPSDTKGKPALGGDETYDSDTGETYVTPGGGSGGTIGGGYPTGGHYAPGGGTPGETIARGYGNATPTGAIGSSTQQLESILLVTGLLRFFALGF